MTADPDDQPPADGPPPAAHFQVVEGPDRDAHFDDLYRSELRPMVRLGFLLTGDRETAAEIAHEAFIRTYERWDRLDNPGGFLRTVVVNRCTDHHRRRIRRATTPMADLGDHAVDDDPDEVLADVIAALRPKQRTAIVLRYYLDLPQAEIAEVMGVRQGTVKSLLHRALAQLRTALEDEPGGSTPARQTNEPNERNPS